MIFTFEKIIALEKERRNLLESRVFDSVPFVRFIRQYQAFSSVKRLEDARKKLELIDTISQAVFGKIEPLASSTVDIDLGKGNRKNGLKKMFRMLS